MPQAQDHVNLGAEAAFAIDGNLKVVAWNRGAEALMGRKAKDVIGCPCYEVLAAIYPDGAALCHKNCPGDLCFGRLAGKSGASALVCDRNKKALAVRFDFLIRLPGHGRKNPGLAVVALTPEENTSAARLQVRTFGRFALSVGKQELEVEKWHRKQAVTLLKYLCLHPGIALHSERLIDLLWPEADEARGQERLKVTMHFLRRQLRGAGLAEDIIETVGKAYVLRREAVWIDAEVYMQQVKEGSAAFNEERWEDAKDCFQEAQRLYRGPFLAEDLYVDWCAEEGARLRQVHLEMLASLVKCCAALAQPAAAAEACRAALALEPCEEHFHRQLMAQLDELGLPDQAIAQFRRCQETLAGELGVEPLPETEQLYRLISDRRAGKRS